jgi:GTP:adenosylcobinamide-phosphate guanylyltransferase
VITQAVITAGGRVEPDFAKVIGTPVKALAPFAGSTFLERTVHALRSAGVGRIAVVGGSEVRSVCARIVDKVIEEDLSGAVNLSRALHAWDGAEPLLYLTSDMPFISAAALRVFCERVPVQTLALPLTEWRDFEDRFPHAPGFGITLAGERVVNGGAFVIPAHSAARIENFAARFFEARKSVWRMARLTGPALLLQFALRRLSIARLERHAQRLLGVPACALRGAPVELAYDVDALEEYRYAIAHA